MAARNAILTILCIDINKYISQAADNIDIDIIDTVYCISFAHEINVSEFHGAY